jgi:hypothetical protein
MHFTSHNTSSMFTSDGAMQTPTDDSSIAQSKASQSAEVPKDAFVVLPGNIIAPPAQTKQSYTSWLVLAPLLVVAFLLTTFVKNNWSQSQSLETKASLGPAVLLATQGKKTITVGENIDIHIPVNANGSEISGMKVVMTYDSTILSLEKILPGTLFTQIQPGNEPVEVTDTSIPGKITYTIQYPKNSNTKATKNGYDAIVLSFISIKAGVSDISFVTEGKDATIIYGTNDHDVLNHATGTNVTVKAQ